MAKQKKTVFVDVDVVGNEEKPIAGLTAVDVVKDMFGQEMPIVTGDTFNPEPGDKIYTVAQEVNEDAVKRLYDMAEDETKAKQVSFVSDIQGLNLSVEVIRLNLEKKPVRVSKVFEFRRGTLLLDDPYEIEALLRHPSYGGEGENASKALEPLFWKTTFPKWKADYVKSTMDKRNQPYEEQNQPDYGHVF